MNSLVDQLIAERRAQGWGTPTDVSHAQRRGQAVRAGPPGLHPRPVHHLLDLLTRPTSGLLSFAVYYLLKNPAFRERARAEADAVLGSYVPADSTARRHLRQVLDEALRLWPTAPGFSRYPRGRRPYAIPAHTPITLALHRDTSVWGPDAAEFNPEHMVPEQLGVDLPETLQAVRHGAARGIRQAVRPAGPCWCSACAAALRPRKHHLGYQLKTKTTLTIKPTTSTSGTVVLEQAAYDRLGGRLRRARFLGACAGDDAARAPSCNAAPGALQPAAPRSRSRPGWHGQGIERGFDVTRGPGRPPVDAATARCGGVRRTTALHRIARRPSATRPLAAADNVAVLGVRLRSHRVGL